MSIQDWKIFDFNKGLNVSVKHKMIQNFKCVIPRAMTCQTFRAPCRARKSTMGSVFKLLCRPELDKPIYYGSIIRPFSDAVFVFRRGSKAAFCTDSNDSCENSKIKLITSLTPPTNLCCMAGCVNCVWFEYADLLIQEYAKKEQTLKIGDIFKEIDEDVEDPNIRAYIKLEIKSKFK